MKKIIIAVALVLFPMTGFAEGRCPPGQYPIGDDRAPGCAPIPGAGGEAAGTGAPVPTGKWETRWGAVVEDAENLSTGASVSMKTRRQAVSAAEAECRKVGGKKCKLRLAYYNQCVAIADPDSRQIANGGGKSMAVSAQTLERAKAMALDQCKATDGGQTCVIAYSACSMSEFKSFR